MQSRNPVLNERAFGHGGTATLERPSYPPTDTSGPAHEVGAAPTTRRMSVEGTVYKTALLLTLLTASAAISWRAYEAGALSGATLFLALIGMLALALGTAFRPLWAPITGPAYALVSGVLVGMISAIYNAAFDGIVAQAALGTVATAGGMLFAYQTGLIRATPKFRRVVVSATLGIMLLYVLSIGLNLFGLSMPLLHDTGPLGILISVVIVGVAALNLVLDFDFIESAAKAGSDPRLEWYGAFSLVVTLVWLYLELLRLLSKLRD